MSAQDNGRYAYLGIDPGASGGLAEVWLSPLQHSIHACTAVKMPATRRDIWSWFKGIASYAAFAVIEKVGGYVKGGEGNVGSAMFNFGTSYGELLMALTAAGIPYEEVPPRKWQAGLGISPRGKAETRTAWKNRLKEKAQQLFPQEKVTLATADALLIAEYCRRVYGGNHAGHS